MGTHPIFESDFDCLTEMNHEKLVEQYVPTVEMNNLVLDYLLTNGHVSVALALQNDIDRTKYTNNRPKVEITDESNIREQIRDEILSGKIKAAEKIINGAYPELLDDDHMLHFSLQIQHLIELIRQKKIEQAVLFAQEDIVEKGDYPECHPELERAMGLLAYDKPEKSPFSDLLKPTYRLKVWTSVNEAIRSLKREKTKSQLDKLTRYVHWSQQLLTERDISYTRLTDFVDSKFSDDEGTDLYTQPNE